MAKIIVVEDSDALRTLFCSIVNEIEGLSLVGEFIGATNAIAAIRRDPPDIVLLDIQLSEGSGVEVMRTVTVEFPGIKVIVASNFADPIYQRYFANAGAYAFFDKSHELKKMRSALENLANGDAVGKRKEDVQSDDPAILAKRVWTLTV